MLVLAGAGTGKTRVITVRIAHLLHTWRRPRVDPGGDVHEQGRPRDARAGRVARGRGSRGEVDRLARSTPSACAPCASTARRSASRPTSRSATRPTSSAAMRGALRELDVAGASIHPRALQAGISLRKNRLADRATALEEAVDDRDLLLARAWERYEEHLRRSRTPRLRRPPARDAAAAEGAPETAARATRERYRYVLVDEYQDTNGPQYEIVQALAGDAPQPVRGRRRRPVDLRLARRGRREDPRLRARLPRLHGRPARDELPLDHRDPRARPTA